MQKSWDKTDFKKQDRKLYAPKAGCFSLVNVPPMSYLMIDGSGSPAGPDYMKAIQALYPVSYKIKFYSKLELRRDYVVAPLSGLWWAEDMDSFNTDDKDQWQWTMMIRQPGWIDPALVANIVTDLQSTGKTEHLHKLRLETYAEGLSAQTLHIGPYTDEGPTIAEMHEEYLPANRLTENGHHHEIYLSDPRKTAPEKLRTILRQPCRAIEEKSRAVA